MRELTGHQVSPADKALIVAAVDAPGSGGANHRYEITGFTSDTNPSALSDDGQDCVSILFQNGPVGEVGVNGITDGALLATVADRLRCFQHGPHANYCNERALMHIRDAQGWLNHRTLERMSRGVEGTHNP